MDNARGIFGAKLRYARNAYECVEGADAMLRCLNSRHSVNTSMASLTKKGA